MRLFLTSSGLSYELGKEFLKLLPKKVQECRVLVVHSAQKHEHLVFVDAVGKEMSRTGVLLPNIDYVNISKIKISKDLLKYDVVYVCGGNTFYILDRLRKTGLDKFLRKFVKSGGLYIGVSAGSIIAGQDISVAGWGSEGDPNDVNLRDLSGLGFTDIAIFPHYKDKLKKEVAEFKLSHSNPVEYLRDGEAIIIYGKSVKMIRLS